MTADSPLATRRAPYDGRPAGIASRLVAAFLDGLVVLTLLGAGYLGFAGLVFMIDPVGFRFPAPRWFVSSVALLVMSVVYLTGGWVTTGRTYGDKVLGLRVVDRAGRPPRVLPALLRAVLCAVFPIGLLWVAVSRHRLSIQDLVLRTSVIYDWSPLAPAPRDGA